MSNFKLKTEYQLLYLHCKLSLFGLIVNWTMLLFDTVVQVGIVDERPKKKQELECDYSPEFKAESITTGKIIGRAWIFSMLFVKQLFQ